MNAYVLTMLFMTFGNLLAGILFIVTGYEYKMTAGKILLSCILDIGILIFSFHTWKNLNR